MRYLIVQSDTTTPTAGQLKRAFKTIRTMTDADAVKLANDAYGVLVKDLSLEDASTLQRALQTEGIATELLEPGRLPRLPDAKFVRRLEIQPHAMTIYDPLGRAVPVPWAHVQLIAAGTVRDFDVNETREKERVVRFDPIRGLHARTVTDVRHKVESDMKHLLDIILTGGVMRFQIEAASFMFKYVFDEPGLDLSQKFALLIQHLARQAPQALLNRGAYLLRENSPERLVYANKAFFFEESAWLLWRFGAASAPKS